MSVTGHRNMKSLDSYIQAPSNSDRRMISSALQNLGQNDESPLTSVTSVPSNTDYTHDVSFSSAQTLNVTRNLVSAMNMFLNATISGGSITFNLVQQQSFMTINNCSSVRYYNVCLTTPLRHLVTKSNSAR
jgi:hypothetical protein